MLTRRNSIVLLTLFAGFAADQHANAGCCDWLFGRKEPAYVVGYTPYAVGYVPQAVVQPVVTQRVALPVSQPSLLLSTGGPSNVAATNGAYQAQRPAYDNPSVYTGMPVIMAPGPTQTSYRLPVAPAAPTVSAYRPIVQAYQQPNAVPLAGSLRGGAAATSNPIYGTGNIYPNNYQVTRYQAAYPATPPAPVTTSAVVPMQPAACPAPVPVVQAAPRKSCCGLSRFFGCCWGNTNYQTSYYRAPITYYRPVTSVDRVSGTTVTAQQPCTSTVQQLQRTPYNSLFTQGAPPMAPAPGSSCGAGCESTSAPNTYLAPSVTTTPSTGAPVYGGQTYGGVGQAGGIASPSDRTVMPIPSTDPSYQPQPSYQPSPPSSYTPSPPSSYTPSPPSSYQPSPPSSYAPSPQPLQGNPPRNGGDLQAVPQPRMESARPSIDEQPQPQEDDSYWGSRDNEERTALNSLPSSGSAKSTTSPYSELRPIQAPKDYQAPIVQRSQSPTASFPSTAPMTEQDLSAPPLLPPPPSDNFNLRGTNSASVRVSVPVREATMTRSRTARPVQRVRDSGGWQAID